MEKVIIDWLDYTGLMEQLRDDLLTHREEFDFIIGIGRGGLIPATYLSHQLKLPMASWMISSYKDELRSEFLVSGNLSHTQQKITEKKILLVDDIVDSAETLKFAVNHLQGSEVQAKLVRTAVVVLKVPTVFTPDYYSKQIPKEAWVVFPYENM